MLKADYLIKEIKYISSERNIPLYLDYLSKKFRDKLSQDEISFQHEKNLFSRYFRGEPVSFRSLPLDLNTGTFFQARVWKAAQNIPYGRTLSYKELASKINHSGYRSIGQALGRNPFLIAVPCHRVIRSDGSLGGFTAGLALKKYLLSLERAR